MNILAKIDELVMGTREPGQAPQQHYPRFPEFRETQPATKKPDAPRLSGEALCQRAAEGIDVVSSSELATVDSFQRKWRGLYEAESVLFTHQAATEEHRRRSADQWRKIYEHGQDFAEATVQTLENVREEFAAKRQLAKEGRAKIQAEFVAVTSPIRKKFLKAARAKLEAMETEDRTEAEYFGKHYVPRPRAEALRQLIARVESAEQSTQYPPDPKNALPWLKL